MRRGSNLPALGGFNETVIFDHIRRSAGGISRVEIASHTGLSAQTVSNVCRRLVDRGMVHESRSEPSGKGKPRVMLTVNGSHRYALGLHLDPLRITWGIFDMRGEMIGGGRAPTSHTDTPEQFMDWVCAGMRVAVAESGIDPEAILGLGVAAPGPLDRVGGVMLTPPLFYGWQNVAIVSGLQARMGMPVRLDRDAAASAAGSLWWGDQSDSAGRATRSAAFIYLGAGIGAGLIIGGEVYRGIAATAGEIGHVTLTAPWSDPSMQPPESGRSGLGPAELVACAMEQGVLGQGINLADPLAVDAAVRNILDAAEAGNVAAHRLRQWFVETLARLGLGLINLLDLEHVAFGGPRMDWVGLSVQTRLLQLLDEFHEARASHGVEVVVSESPKLDAVLGGAALVFSEEFAPQSTSLLVMKGEA